MRTLFYGGTVVDGSGAPGYLADVLIEDDRIIAIAPAIRVDADRLIDCTGLIVSPG